MTSCEQCKKFRSMIVHNEQVAAEQLRKINGVVKRLQDAWPAQDIEEFIWGLQNGLLSFDDLGKILSAAKNTMMVLEEFDE